MTNSITKITFLAISALFVALTGCKKDDDVYPSFRADELSIDFEWGQTKELTYTASHINKIQTPTAPDGWSCIYLGDRFVITAPAEGSGAPSSGLLTLNAMGDNGSLLTRNIPVAIRMAEEIPGGANSIIVSEPGKRYKFKATGRGNETGQTLTAATKATRLWTTSRTAIVRVSLESGYIYFSTGDSTGAFEEANAVVAAQDKDGNTLWSWHIWMTADDPTLNPDYLGDHLVMNRNLGAFTNSNATPEDAVRSYGLYYQWGRKDPFVGPVSWNSTVAMPIYNSGGSYLNHNFGVSTAETGTVEYSIANPNTFIAGNEDSGFDWLMSSRRDLWSTTSKTIYDPCPLGWRVAPPTIWRDFTTTGGATGDPAEFSIEGEYQYGWTFVVDDGLQYHPPLDPDQPLPDHFLRIFYPAAGRRNFSPGLARPDGNFTNVINDGEGIGYPVGFYWSSEYPIPLDTAMYPAGKTSALAFRRDYINPADRSDSAPEHAPAGGFPLRCVAE